MNKGKSYTVKEWFANKVADEVGRNINMCDVFAILKETEKAVYGMLNLGCNRKKTMWIPKSVLIENEIGTNEDQSVNYETYIVEDYDKAAEMFNDFWKAFN